MSNSSEVKEEKSLSIAEKRVIFLKKYGLIGFLSLISPMLIPIGIEWIAGQLMDKKMAPIIQKLDKINDEIIYTRAFNATSNMKTLISSSDWNTLVRHRIRSQSLDKIKEIKRVVSGSDRKTEDGKKRLWVKVKNILYSNTNIYVNELNRYAHPVVGDIGSYLAKTFPFRQDKTREYRPEYSFLGVIYNIVVLDTESDMQMMSENLVEYMKAIQDEYFNDHYYILKELEQKAKFRD